MITSRFNFFKGAVAVLAAMPIAAAATFTFAGSAQAALIGSFDIDNNGNVQLSADSLTFLNPSTFNVSNPTGSFSDFSLGSIGSIISFADNTADNPFMDLGIDAATITDGLNTYTLNSAAFNLSQISDAAVGINVTTTGFFTSAGGVLSTGSGDFTFQAQGVLDDIETLLASGGSINATYSGISLASVTQAVPEPAALLGLGVVAAGMAVSRRRKTIPQ